MYCPSCKQEYDGKFCPECGTKLIEKPAASGVSLNLGDANAISVGVHMSNSNNVHNEGLILDGLREKSEDTLRKLEEAEVKGQKLQEICPKDKTELLSLIMKRIVIEGSECNLNNIDVSNVEDMSGLFMGLDFNGDISEWDVSNVTDMSAMFAGCDIFEGKGLESWDVSNVKNMTAMFNGCINFEGKKIENWSVTKVKEMYFAFDGCKSTPSWYKE